MTCRRRKLKCDERKPECGQCRKSAKVCEPGEIVFRHHQNPSLSRGRDTLNKFFSKRHSFTSSDTWLAIPETGQCRVCIYGVSLTAALTPKPTVSFITVDPAAESDAAPEREPRQRTTSVGDSRPDQDPANDGLGLNNVLRRTPDPLDPGSTHLVDILSPPHSVPGGSMPFGSPGNALI